MTTGRIDVHSHLLPGVDDGCRTVQESVQCARMMVEAGYTHSFCTPHVWPSLPHNTPGNIRRMVLEFQTALDEAQIPLRVFHRCLTRVIPVYLALPQATRFTRRSSSSSR